MSKGKILFLNGVTPYTVKSNPLEIKELFQMMIKSDNIEVATKGAELITTCYIFYQKFEDLLQCSLDGSIHLKKGVASISGGFFV
ncbi:hypothetical protein SAMN05661091_3204 [Paenibacillus uliginis N3/975]|uniref:Uncharacterized protein n=1 Tax=Paenibacillus uliginis N3/975 TaxID=1313296 RepID=A0A1X7HGU1_9BACL|nr:hypothetical protein [Paenibacillus uliginis]SMF85882.1 hypothetical protein SAMN05661091_3204 [Paenibacillus uliginis N3/975]